MTNTKFWASCWTGSTERRARVRELIVSARDSGRQPFPNWK